MRFLLIVGLTGQLWSVAEKLVPVEAIVGRSRYAEKRQFGFAG
ncbi:hypothetical protein [Nitrosomonas sp. Nm51]|nr:hypothetical protein [Nitrosomonas sp. Nm51]